MKHIFFLLSTTVLLTLATPGAASISAAGSKTSINPTTPINPTTSITPSTPMTSRPVFRRNRYQEQQ